MADAVQIIGSLDTAAPGLYVMTYLVEDANGEQADGTRALTVTEAESGAQTRG